MDSRTEFDDDERFFESYDADLAAVEDARAALELDAAESSLVSPEQLARRARLRKFVTWSVTALALFSLLALEEHAAQQHGAERELVAHYGAAMPAAVAPTAPTAPIPDASQAAVFVSALTSMCLPDVDSDLALAVESDTECLAEPAPPESCQAREAWSLRVR